MSERCGTEYRIFDPDVDRIIRHGRHRIKSGDGHDGGGRRCDWVNRNDIWDQLVAVPAAGGGATWMELLVASLGWIARKFSPSWYHL